ncbi:hypothetical protein [Histidinibacterium lentulum]|nr:hypothetical protein [Histidinibacterium lentulum]
MKRTPLIIHAGTPKTGTTAAQNALFFETRALESLHLSYPGGASVFTNPDRLTGNGAATARALSSEAGDRIHPKEGIFRLRHRRLLEEIASLPPEQGVVLSSEFFSGFGTRSWQRLFAEFPPDRYDVSVIFYVRNQVDQVQSALGQSVKRGQRVNPDSFFVRATEGKRFLDYDWLLTTLKGHPFKTVVFRAYDRTALVGGDIGCDLFATLASLVGAEQKTPVEPGTSDRNPSLSARSIRMKNFLNRTKPTVAENDLLLATLKAIDFGDRSRPASYLSTAQIAQITPRFEKGNENLVKMFGESFEVIRHSRTKDLPFLDISGRPPPEEIEVAMTALSAAAVENRNLSPLVQRAERLVRKVSRAAV